jgi:hypothetical protein
MAARKILEQPLSLPERRAMKFMAARLQEDESRYKAFLATLDPRQRQDLDLSKGPE